MRQIERTGEKHPLAGGAGVFHVVELDAGEFVHAVAEQHGVDIALRLVDPEGELVVEVDSPIGAQGAEELVAVAAASGRYRLEIDAAGQDGVEGEIVLHELVRRSATAEDRALVEADEAFRDGRRLYKAGELRPARERLQAALEEFRRQQWSGRRALALDALGLVHESNGVLQLALDCCEEALKLYGESGYGHMAPHLLDRIGWLLLRLGQAREAAERFEAAVQGFEDAGETRRWATALARLGSALRALGDLAAAERHFERALELVEGAEDELSRARILVDYGALLVSRQRAEEAVGVYREAADIYQRHGRDRELALALSGLAAARAESGEVERGEQEIADALERLDPADRRNRAVALNTLGNLRRRAGDLDGARAAYDEALALARGEGDRATEAVVLLGRGHVDVLAGEAEEGLARIDGAQEIFAVSGDPVRERTARVRAAEALNKLDRPGEALERLQPVLDAWKRQQDETARPEHLTIANDVLTALDRLSKRPYDPIEPPVEPTDPVNTAHTDLPGGGDFEAADPESREQLAEAVAASRERRRRAAFDLNSPPQAELPEDGPTELGRRLIAAWRKEPPTALLDQARLAQEYEEAAKEEIKLRKSRRELPSDVDPHDLAETGWGIVLSREEDPAVVNGLDRLIARRREQAGSRFRELTYRRDESGRHFLWNRYGESPGVLDPEVLPYYLLIVGGPETIPFDLQYSLAINHAVGRIAFDDPADYRRYAEFVLEAEDFGVELPRRATIFSVENERDSTTARLARYLVAPLRQRLVGTAEWELDVWEKEQSYKRDLRRLLGGDATPGLLLASCHGAVEPAGSPQQLARQGALLCRDWTGDGSGARAPENSLSGADLDDRGARLHGLIAYLFACYGAGTPVEDSFPHERRGNRTPFGALAPEPFIASLPQALLSQGALAIVGHVDRGWTTAFQWQFAGDSTEAVRSLEDSLRQLLSGGRIGHTLRPLVRRHTAIASQLAESLERVRNGEPVDHALLAFQWTAHNDARNLILLGDPAVYLLGQRCWHEEVGESRVGLAEDVLQMARGHARAAGMGVEEWLNQLVRQQPFLRGAGSDSGQLG